MSLRDILVLLVGAQVLADGEVEVVGIGVGSRRHVTLTDYPLDGVPPTLTTLIGPSSGLNTITTSDGSFHG